MGIFKKDKRRFGEILVDKGLATKEDVQEALRIQKELKENRKIQKKIGMILNEKGVIGLEDIDAVLKEQKNDSFIIKGLIYSIFHSR